MRKGTWVMGVAIVAMTVAAAAGVARAQGFEDRPGYLQDVQDFPNMLTTVPDCATVYSEFLTIAQPLIACQHLEEAKDEQSAQQALSKQLGAIKNCKKCQAQMGMADEAAAAYADQVNTYGKQCPPKGDQIKLAGTLGKKAKEVCSRCNKKWPGKLGTADNTPCD